MRKTEKLGRSLAPISPQAFAWNSQSGNEEGAAVCMCVCESRTWWGGRVQSEGWRGRRQGWLCQHSSACPFPEGFSVPLSGIHLPPPTILLLLVTQGPG